MRSNPINSAPVITSSPSEDHTYSTGGIGGTFIFTLPLLPSLSNDKRAMNDVSVLTSAASTIITSTGLANNDDQNIHLNLQNKL